MLAELEEIHAAIRCPDYTKEDSKVQGWAETDCKDTRKMISTWIQSLALAWQNWERSLMSRPVPIRCFSCGSVVSEHSGIGDWQA